MVTKPTIAIQLVHFEGPLKGEIQTFTRSVVKIGRDPAWCEVIFPRDARTISRKHALIVREGNRFKLMNRSPNKTFVNGKPVEEGFLNEGDIIMFAPDGPKVSFSTEIIESQAGIESPPVPRPRIDVEPPTPTNGYEDRPPPVQHRPGPHEEVKVSGQKVQAPLAIQYGPTLQSFKELPVTIGKNPTCDFVLPHPAILDRHVQFIFGHDQYWVKDLTAQNLISINGQNISSQAPLNPNDLLALSPQGPTFKFLGRGRLVEIE